MLVILAISLLWWVGNPGEDRADRGVGPTGRPTATLAASTDPESGLSWVALADLPAQASRTVRLIDSDGPFPYAEDGSVFGNHERLLPLHSDGYYREYTVPTPGESARGARRIIRGQSGQLYRTADHYLSFQRIRR